MKMRLVATLLSALALVSSGSPALAQVRGSRHDLSARSSARGVTNAPGEICVFCHTPHVAEATVAAWSRSESNVLYKPYSSPTMQASVGQPTGASKICLSCHDGTIAQASVPDPASATGGWLSSSSLSNRANLTSDLSDDHPVSFPYDSGLAAQDPELRDPSSLPPEVWLDKNDELQCTSCHEPHSTVYPDFLVMDNENSELCISCHDPNGWDRSAHATSPAGWDGSGTDPWPYTDARSVSANGCSSCHTPHSAGIPESLLVYPREEDNCLSCHDGSTAVQDIAADFRKSFRHPIDQFDRVHVAVEDPISMPRHVECHDCHDPHEAYGGTASAPNISPSMVGAQGVSASGAPLLAAEFDYEVCFRCHADGADVPAPYVEREILQPNIRFKLDPRNPSFHPVEESGQNPNVPSLIFPLNEASIISCTDCHSSDSGASGSGARGPHGSVWPFLLEDEYQVSDGANESYRTYALCYKCHDRNVVLSSASFSGHRSHVVEYTTPCSACHDPHGISASQGNPANNSHLINFDTSIVEADPGTGLLRFEDLGENRGRCYLQCHGGIHSPLEY